MMQSRFVRALTLGVAMVTGAASRGAAQNVQGDFVLHAQRATMMSGAWSLVSDATAADGLRLDNPDRGKPKLTTPLAVPIDYVEFRFTPRAGVPYHLWIRSKAQNDSWTNDSVFVQFSGSESAGGAAIYRIGTTSAAMYSLEEGSGAGESGWGWQDNGYGYNVLGDAMFFDGTTQTVRIQAREDGIAVDQIVLSPVTYATRAPGAGKNDTTILREASDPVGSGTITVATPTAFTWTALVKASASGSTLTKTSGCADCYDAGGTGQATFSAGSVSFAVSPGLRAAVGLGADASANTSYLVNYAFSFSGRNIYEVREGGIYRTEGVFNSGDVFTVTANGTTITYSRNGALIYTSKVTQPGPLTVDSSIATVGGTIQVTAFSTASTTTTPTATPTPPPPTTTGAVTLRVLQWNTHHGGIGTDNIYDTNRLATWAASMKPDVVMFNEIEKFSSVGQENQPEIYKNLLQQKTGKTWYYTFAQEFGDWSANGKGNLILSTYPMSYSTAYELVHNGDRSIALASIAVNGRPITLIGTHLDPSDAALRLTQAQEVTSWSAPQPENRIIAGDMNAWPDQTSIAHFNTLYNDSWSVAVSNGTATAFVGNNGQTKNGRIDYIFYSKGSSNLTVVSSQVYDTRDVNGYMPSDHRPVLTTFSVK